MGVQDVNTLLGIGGLQQQQGQRELDIARANQLAQQALPFQRIGFMSDIFRGVPNIATNIFNYDYTTTKQNITNVRTWYCISGCGWDKLVAR